MFQENGEDEIEESQYSRSCSGKSQGSRANVSRRSSSQIGSQSRHSDSNDLDNQGKKLKRNKASAEKSDDFLLCSKCIKVSQLTKPGTGGMADILLGTKSVEDFFPPGTFHK